MELREIRFFLAVARSLSFTEAAEECRVTQATVTKAIRKLEGELGDKLFDRERKLLQLTDLGRVVLPVFGRMAHQAENVHVQTAQSGFDQRLCIGLSPSVSASLLVEPMARLMTIAPRPQITLVEDSVDGLIRRMLNDRVQVAIVGEHGSDDRGIKRERLFDESYVALMSPTHLLAQFSTIPAGLMSGWVWLWHGESDSVKPIEKASLAAGVTPESIQCGRQETHLQYMAAAGLGLLVVPEHVPNVSGLLRRPIESDSLRRSVEMLTVVERPRSAIVREFMSAMQTHDWLRHLQDVETRFGAASRR